MNKAVVDFEAESESEWSRFVPSSHTTQDKSSWSRQTYKTKKKKNM